MGPGGGGLESQAYTHTQQSRNQILKEGLVFVLAVLVVSPTCTDFSKYAFFLSLFLGRQDTVRERSLSHSLLSPAP